MLLLLLHTYTWCHDGACNGRVRHMFACYHHQHQHHYYVTRIHLTSLPMVIISQLLYRCDAISYCSAHTSLASTVEWYWQCSLLPFSNAIWWRYRRSLLHRWCHHIINPNTLTFVWQASSTLISLYIPSKAAWSKCDPILIIFRAYFDISTVSSYLCPDPTSCCLVAVYQKLWNQSCITQKRSESVEWCGHHHFHHHFHHHIGHTERARIVPVNKLCSLIIKTCWLFNRMFLHDCS